MQWDRKLKTYPHIESMLKKIHLTFLILSSACGDCAFGVISDCYRPMCVTADGIERGLLSINRQVPGPQIHVCKNDVLIIDVTNDMHGTAASVHWHGFHLKKTPYMDGVPFVTQCPIPYGTTFRYTFRATEAGTFFYHSHAGHHKTDGIYGGIVVREPAEDNPHVNLYDDDLTEHLVITSDWMHDSSELWISGLSTRMPGVYPTNLLINGRGKFWLDSSSNRSTLSPLEIFRVHQNKRYRFRFVNSGSHTCIFKLQIEKHRMKIIASDSYPVLPVDVDTLYASSGERYDFVVDANQVAGNYWVKLGGSGACEDNGFIIEQYAMLTYSEEENLEDLAQTFRPIFSSNENPFLNGIILNYPNTTCYLPDDDFICMADLQSTSMPDYDLISGHPSQRIVLGYDEYIADNNFIYSKYLHFMSKSIYFIFLKKILEKIHFL